MKLFMGLLFYYAVVYHSQIKSGGLFEAAGSVKNNINMIL